MPEENWDRFNFPIIEPYIKHDDLEDIPIVGQANAQIYVELPVRRDCAGRNDADIWHQLILQMTMLDEF